MVETLTREQVNSLFPARNVDTNKADYGYIALVGGCTQYSGAIRLSNLANSAMRSGVGVCTIAAPSSVCDAIMPQILESTIFPLSDKDGNLVFVEKEFDALMHRNSVIAFGMGIGDTEEVEKAIKYLLENYDGILIVDADGINAMSRLGKKTLINHQCKLILTPHPKEFSRLSGRDMEDVLGDPDGSAEGLAKFLNAIVLLKGHTTYVSDGNRTFEVAKGTPAMATAGSGDVLAGILSAIAAVHKDKLLLATAGAAYINGYAGEIAEEKSGETSLIASDTASCVKEAILRSLEKDEKTVKRNRRILNVIRIVTLCLSLGVAIYMSWYAHTQRLAARHAADTRSDYAVSMKFLAKDIYIDGVLVNNYELRAPFAILNDKILVPLTEDVCDALGIYAYWDPNKTSEILIKPVTANHKGVFYSEYGWNLAPVMASAKPKATITIESGKEKEVVTVGSGEVVSFNDGEIIYIAISTLRDTELIELQTYYDDIGGLYISTDSGIAPDRYVSEENMSYIQGRCEYIQSRLTNFTIGECSVYEYLFRHEANVMNVEEDLLLAMANTESGFYRYAISSAGALGMMQVMASTAIANGIDPGDLFDVHTSIEFGAKYIRDAITNYGDVKKALSAYNFGGGAVLAGNFNYGYAETVLGRQNDLRNRCNNSGYSNEFLTEVTCTK